MCGSRYENGGAIGESDSSAGFRSLADVYIPRWRGGPPAAWDFAVTSGSRLDALVDSVRDPAAALTKYDDFRCSYQDTKSQCQAQGISFIPMVMGAVGGGWGRSARGVWSELAKINALATGELETESICAVMLLQRLSMTLHRENARAVMRRMEHMGDQAVGSSWNGATFSEALDE